MSKSLIIVAADHNGFTLKQDVIAYIKKLGYEVKDAGDEIQDPQDDFPVFASRAIMEMHSSENARAVLICGSGQGMMMAANRFKGIRAGLGWSVAAARSIRTDEDSNVLALPAEVCDLNGQWQAIIDTWLTTPFAGAQRYVRRNAMLDELN